MLLGPRTQLLQAAAVGSGARQEALAAAERRLAALRHEVLSLEERLEARGQVPGSSPFAGLSRTRRRLYRLYEDSFRTAILNGALAGGGADS